MIDKLSQARHSNANMLFKQKPSPLPFFFTLQNLSGFKEFAKEFNRYCSKLQLPKKFFIEILLPIEEILVNSFKYGYENHNAEPHAEIRASKAEGLFRVEITDRAESFNPLLASKKHMKQESLWLDQPLGGFGLHLIEHFIDFVEYKELPMGNQITLYKKIDGGRFGKFFRSEK